MEDVLQESYWDSDSETYDQSAEHHPTSLAERAAWLAAMERLLPPAPAKILDCGAGTGFLTLLAAELGHHVTAVDSSKGMLEQLRAKADRAGLAVHAVKGEVSDPAAVAPGPFDVVMQRSVIWLLVDPVGTVRRWREIAPGGRLLLFEQVRGHLDPLEVRRKQLRDLVHRLKRLPPEHHAPFDADLVRTLPLVHSCHPSQLIALVEEAGWPRRRLIRLVDVEWASMVGTRIPNRLLGTVPRFVVVAGS
ncbi:MAG: class I SAM-dependent methyltransferase [Acidimicrobiales bacterium]|nr:class I SAM-dependent methyltransferase [Acidimicrobiales bacterium]